MVIRDTAISIRYKKIENIKKLYFQNDETLKDKFNEATILPIPDDAPLEIPRIIIKSKSEHSQINITPVNMTLQTNYNNGFERDWMECVKYILGMANPVFQFLNTVTTNEYEYIGLVVNVLIDDEKINTAQLLASNLLKSDAAERIYDLSLRYTFVEGEDKFVNIQLQNLRVYRPGLSAEVAGELSLTNQESEVIGATIDVNDRFGFNNLKGYRSNQEKLNELLDLASNVINYKLSEIIHGGVY